MSFLKMATNISLRVLPRGNPRRGKLTIRIVPLPPCRHPQREQPLPVEERLFRVHRQRLEVGERLHIKYK